MPEPIVPGTPGAQATQAPTPPTATTSVEPPAQVLDDDDPDAQVQPSPRKRIEISEAGLASRLERAKRQAADEARAAVYRELGIETPDKLKAEREELQKLKDEQEKAKREKLSREEQLNADLEAERAKRAKAEQDLQAARQTSTYAQQDALITQIAIRHVDPTSRVKVSAAKVAFSDYVQTLSKDQRARLSEAAIDRWFRRFVRQEPDFAPKAPVAPTSAAPAASTTPVRKPISSPTPPRPPAPGAQPKDPTIGANGKTTLPGRPNSMNRKELREHLAKIGQKPW